MGATKTAVCYDYAAGYGLNRVMGTGDWAYCNEPNSVLDSSMVVVWGTNPVFTAPQNWRWIQWAKENGTKVICIDPIRLTCVRATGRQKAPLPTSPRFPL